MAKKFAPITLTLSTPAAVANVLGALIAYGSANLHAENGLKAIGIGKWYSGNVRKASRDAASAIASAAGLTAPDFSAYTNSSKFRSSAPSQAGEAVRGTEFDLAPGRPATSFEPQLEVPEVEEADEPITVTL